MTTLLVMTVGLTDVQLVDQGKKREFAKDRVGALHDQLREHPDFWKLVDAPPERGESARELPEGLPWEICAPKFDAVLASFGETPPTSVLLLETKRNIPGDPRFAGGLLQMRAKDKGIDDVRCCAYLGPADRNLEDRDCPLDAIIRRDVVRRIEDAIRDAVKDAKRVLVATTGGMPEIKALVKELARLHAPEGVEPDEIEVDDGARNNGQPDRAVSRERVDPIEPIRLRKQALSLISRGSLVGAWGAVQHLDAQAHPWTLVVKWLYYFASSLPIPAECDIEVLRHPRMAMRAALRVELALRAGDIPRAVHGTVAFLESALWDHLATRVERHPSRSRLFRIVQPPLPAELVRDENANDNSKRPFDLRETIDGVDWYWIHDERVCCTRLAKRYLALDGLEKLAQASNPVAWDLRNDIAHNEPTPGLMNSAGTGMQDAALWSSDNKFLSQSLVQSVLKELGEASPENLLTNLLTEVRRRLLSPPHALTGEEAKDV